MGFFDRLFGWKEDRQGPRTATPPRKETGTSTPPRKQTAPTNTSKANSDGHYVLKCIDCNFTHHIPSDYINGPVKFAVDTNKVEIVCVYGGAFTVTLRVKDLHNHKSASFRSSPGGIH